MLNSGAAERRPGSNTTANVVNVDDRSAFKTSWHFIVSETPRHRRGHTLYKVTLQIVPVDVSAAIKEVVWWKRYSDFALLHKHLSSLHAALFLKGQFPAFPKPQLLGRYEEQVVELRRSASEKLLNFVCNYPILLRNEIFQNFLEGGETFEHGVGDYDPTVPLRPQSISSNAGSTSGRDLAPAPSSSSSADLDRSSKEGAKERVLSPVRGIWHHRLPDLDDVDWEVVNISPEPSGLYSPPSLSSVDLDLKSADSEQEAVDVVLGSEEDEMFNSKLPSPRYMAAILAPERPNHLSGGDAAVAAMGCTAESADTNGAREEDYLFVAGHHLARAADKELAGEYEEAFGLYKLGIDILLQGVQNDEDAVRRDAVRRKTTNYLNKAEQLYADHIQASATASSSLSTLDLGLEGKQAALAGTISQLAQYTVVKVLAEGVLLAVDRSSQQTRVIKTLSKCSGKALRGIQPTIVPTVRYMVRLLLFIQTDEAIFLVLEPAQGGKLWNYLCSTSAESRRSANEDADRKLDDCAMDEVKEASNWRQLARHLQLEGAPMGSLTLTDSSLFPPAETEDVSDGYSNLFLKYTRTSSSTFARDNETKDDNSPPQQDKVETEGEKHLENAIAESETGFLERILGESESIDPGRNKAGTALATALTHWTDVTNIDSDHLIAQSKQLLESVEKTMGTEGILDVNEITATEHVEQEAVVTEPVMRSLSAEWPEECEVEPVHQNKCQRRLPEGVVRVWLSEILLALEELHELGVVCQHLTIDNLLLGSKGQVLLTYWSQWNCVWRQAGQNCRDGKLCYHVAPETRATPLARRLGKGQGQGQQGRALRPVDPISDSWSFGLIALQLLAGQEADMCSNVARVSRSGHLTLQFHSDLSLSREAEDLLRKLIRFSARERLTLPEAKQHPFFSSIDWRKLARPNNE